MISLNKIIQAKRTISGFVYKTPFAYSAKLSLASGALIYLKEENLQRTGAYKIRGAYNKIANLSEQERKKGVKTLWLQLGITNDSAGAVARENGINFVQDKCIKIELQRLDLG